MYIRTRAFNAWDAMIQRCSNPNNPKYRDYGGRGIQVCTEWRVFANFLKDMGEPALGQSLDRRNNQLGYSKANCRWADASTQNLNKRPRKDSKSGISGVRWIQARGYWVTHITKHSIDRQIYYGPDFFEACCARKAWEAANARTS